MSCNDMYQQLFQSRTRRQTDTTLMCPAAERKPVFIPEYPNGDLSLFVLTGLIVAGAFSLTVWYGWQLRAVDWSAKRALMT
jgi:hypothetical protein